MKALAALLCLVFLLAACGGGGGNPGQCGGSAELCAEFGGGSAAPGTNTGGAVEQSFARSGTGDAVFKLPTTVRIVRIQATFAGAVHTFVVRIAGVVVVDDVLGTQATPPSFDGTYLVPAGANIEISEAAGVSWVVTQDSSDPAPEGTFNRTGSGDDVFELPPRVTRVRIRATSTRAANTFAVRIAGRVVVNTVVGVSQNPQVFDEVISISGGGTVEIIGANGASWTILEVQ